jgi:uncharacterized protein Yka (UPF0111/DUF47 family)
MEKRTNQTERREKRGIFGAIFPREHDFEGMLVEQAERTLDGVQALVDWLHEPQLEEPAELDRIGTEVDGMRHEMEAKLIDSFSTPFDRQDIYSLSRQMDYILNFSRETAREMYAFGVATDPPIHAMAEALLRGTGHVADGVRVMRSDKRRVRGLIREARHELHAIEEIYIAGMAEVFNAGDAMEALRKREVYHHLRDAGRALRNTVDILHNVVVGLT